MAKLNLNDSDNESELDDTLDIYGFANFSERNSQMKINKWKSQTDDEFEQEPNFNNQFRFKKSDGFSLDNNPNTSRLSSASNRINTKYSPRYNTISTNTNVQKEYETQSITLDFNDDASLASNNLDQKLVNLRNHPKTEARVYVNNPEIFMPPNIKQLNQVSPRNFVSSTNVSPKFSNVNTHQDTTSNSTPNRENKFFYHQDSKQFRTRTNETNPSITSSSHDNLYQNVVNVSRKQPAQYKSTLDLTNNRKQPTNLVRNISPLPMHSPKSTPSPATAPPPPSSAGSRKSAAQVLTIQTTSVPPQQPPSLPPPPPPPSVPLLNISSSPKTSGHSAHIPQNSALLSAQIAPPSSLPPLPPPSIPPPPPPPPPPTSLFAPKQDGLLKFQKTTNTIGKANGKNMDSLHEELEKKLVKIRQSVDEANITSSENKIDYVSPALISLDNNHNIHRFDPNLVDDSDTNSNHNSGELEFILNKKKTTAGN